jgi:hypothetical protein
MRLVSEFLKENYMTLIEALEQAKRGDILSRKYTVDGAGSFTLWGEVQETEHGKFLKAGWEKMLKLENLKATDWEINR